MRIPGALLFLLLFPFSTHALESLSGRVAYSNGTEAEGTLSLSPGKTFRLQRERKALRSLTLSQVASLRFMPTREEMVQKWRFPEAGKTRKEKWGEPYPMRHLVCTLHLTSGEILKGHLYTTVLHLQRNDTVEKVILRAKQRGKPGETLAGLIYPLGIEFKQLKTSSAECLTFTPPLPKTTTCVILPHIDLMRSMLQSDQNGRLPLPSGLNSPLFLATREKEMLTVGWSNALNQDLVVRVKESLASQRDFFDEKKLLGLHFDRENDNLYSLMLLSRGRKTTLNREASLPWRLEVWRWKGARDSESKLMLAGRGFFFRGIRNAAAPLPTVRLDPTLQLNTDGARVKRISTKRQK
jgi:hypothetical protein